VDDPTVAGGCVAGGLVPVDWMEGDSPVVWYLAAICRVAAGLVLVDWMEGGSPVAWYLVAAGDAQFAAACGRAPDA
jgi:hypothetical protein